MTAVLDGDAIVYCEGSFNTTNGKTAHGLVRRTSRYRVCAVVDSRYAGKDAGEVLDGKHSGIPLADGIPGALKICKEKGSRPAYMVIGLAPDGGRLSPGARNDVREAIRHGLNVDSGLHDFLSEDPELVKLAEEKHVTIRDIRRTPPREELHFFSGKIEEVSSLKIAVLGTDSAIGKRTTAWILVDAFSLQGISSELIGTGQTAWLQGARYSLIMDSLINDFVSGEIEHAVWTAWREMNPDVIIIEGQGSLMNPAYPGGFEILAAGRPDLVVLQHAPARKEYDGFPGYPLHPLQKQIDAIEMLSGIPVVAVTLNHENLKRADIDGVCEEITRDTGLICCDPLWQGVGGIMHRVEKILKEKKQKNESE